MSTATTPAPPAPPQQPVPPQPAPTPSSPTPASRVVAIIAIVVGGILVLGAVGWAVATTLFSANVRTSTATVATTGVQDLSVDVSAGSLRIEFADVDEAELDVRSAFGADRWTLERDDDELRVASPRFFGLGWLFDGAGDAVLRLPLALEGLDAELGLSAGDLSASGAFGELDVDVSAGRAEIDGSANDVSVDVSAGRADLDVDGVRTGELTVSAGDLDVSFTGTPPRELSLDVSAGSLRLEVPEGEYDVRSDVSAGGFDNRIGSTPGAPNTVTVTVSAGNAELRAN
ncbi:hypothetical protein [Microbacterium sp. RU33B]|uniref:hypothetical protein n=1 Tax=Microbacterium sp. RU33B TaxID=1907390 RepID=UPI000967DC66|nr:hypothetical protein [Microbacterium sp. RU33B]SIT86863.1 hypothetical protein SAMN05880545_2659 [Microbacterium sp. RU33B]